MASPISGPIADFRVAHGAHPTQSLFDLGLVPVQPLRTCAQDGDIVFTYLVRPVQQTDRRPRRRRVVHQEPTSSEQPKRHQRIGAYALVRSQRGLLGTMNSRLSGSAGAWSLPGGGIDPGETPAEATLREVYEETGQRISLDRVLTLDSEHWIGRSLTGQLEDFHALRIFYLAECTDPTEPTVHDEGGSTERAGWIQPERWSQLRWTAGSRQILARFAHYLSDAPSP